MGRHPDPERLLSFEPPWSRSPIHLAAYRQGAHRATVAVTSAQVLSDPEWAELARVLDRGVMYDLAPDAAWEVIEIRNVQGQVAVSRVTLTGPEQAVQRGPWSSADAGTRVAADLPYRMLFAPPAFRHALSVCAAVRAHLAVRDSSHAGALSHPLYHFPAGTPTPDVQAFLNLAQPRIGPDVWGDLRQLHAQSDLPPGSPLTLALRALLITPGNGPRRAAQVGFLSWDTREGAETLSELNLAALDTAEDLLATLCAALRDQPQSDMGALIDALCPHAALLSRGFCWSTTPSHEDAP